MRTVRHRFARHVSAAALSVLAAAFALPALANDSTAVIATGGLKLVRTDAVQMASEDLYVSEKQIRVRYVFHPVDGKELVTIVAFPLPLIFINNMDANIGLPAPAKDDPLNLVDFHVRVDGKPVKPRIQARALVNGVDKTAILKKYGIPLTDQDDPVAFQKKLDSLPPAARAELEDNKLVDWNSQWDENNRPMATYHWDLELVYYWRQTFSGERDVTVDHDYRPIAGAFFYMPSHPEPWVKKTYCTDESFIRAAARKVKGKDEYAALLGAQVHYILTTAGNWAGSIGRFHLVLDKGAPDNLISLCWKGHLKKTSPTRFEFTARDFTPEGELKVLIVKDIR